MVSSTSAQMASSTQTLASQQSTPSKPCSNIDEEGGMIKKQCLNNEDLNKLPEFDEVPPQLRDEIRNDNVCFANEQGKQQIRNTVFRSQTSSKKNPNSRDSDDSDDPPNSCNDKTISYCKGTIKKKCPIRTKPNSGKLYSICFKTSKKYPF